MYIKRILVFALAVSLFSACATEEGKGGLASIEGVVMVQNINALFEKSGEVYPASDEDVYISYGNSNLVDDKTKTSFNGAFKFSNLTKGDYTIFVYSDDTISNAKYPKLQFSQSISLSEKKDEAKADNFVIYRHVDFDDGNGTVSGSVKEYFCTTLGSLIDSSDAYAAQDIDVYLQYQGSDEILEKARTDSKGNFIINKLIPAKYKLYVFSESSKFTYIADSACYRYFEITDNNQKIVLPEISIRNF